MAKQFLGFPVLLECPAGRFQTGLSLSKFTPATTVANRLRAAGERVASVRFDERRKRWIATVEHFA